MRIEQGESKNTFLTTIDTDKPLVCLLLSIQLPATKNHTETAARTMYGELLLSGAGKYTRTEFLSALNDLGARIEVSYHDSVVTLKLSCLAQHAKKVSSLIAVMIFDPHFKQKEIVRVKRNLSNQLKEVSEDARQVALIGFTQAIYTSTDHRYRPLPQQLLAKVNEVKRSDILQVHQSVHASRWFVSIAAPKEEARLFSTILHPTSELNVTSILHSTHYRSTPTKLTLVDVPAKQNIELAIGSALPLSLSEPEYASASFAISVLGIWGGFAGRLMSTVREKEGLTYAAYARTEAASKLAPGHWRIFTFFDPNNTEKGIESVRRQLESMHKRGISQSELERFKKILHTRDVLVYDSLAELIERIHLLSISNLSFAEYVKLRDRVQQLTRTDVNQVVKNYLDPQQLCISAAGPTSNIAKQLTTRYS